MPSPPDKPTRPPRRFSAIKPPTRRREAALAAEPFDATDLPVPALAEAPPSPAPTRDAEPAAAGAAASADPVPPSSQPRPEKASDTARIAKVMARAGLCSRRDAEAWIADGRVAVNGTVLTSPALDIGPTDVVAVDGYPIDKPERTRLFLFNKARGLVTTSRDPEGRPTIFDALPPELPRLVTVGRLDINTEGLLLLTNDGGLARLLELPSTGWIRRYRVRANGSITPPELDALAKGITVGGVAYGGIAAKLDRVQGANLWLTVGLKEGKNREIKRVLEHLGLAVTRLIRISFGPFQLGELADNAVEEVRTRVLRDQLGSALAKQAGVDFDGPAGDAAPVPAARRPRATGRAAVPQEPRRRTERAATADRRGRPVTVERITTPAAGRERIGRAAPRQAGPAAPDRDPRRREAHDERPRNSAGPRRRDDRDVRKQEGSSPHASPSGVAGRHGRSADPGRHGRSTDPGRPPRRDAAPSGRTDERGDGRASGPRRPSETRWGEPARPAAGTRPPGRGKRDGDAGPPRAPRPGRTDQAPRGPRGFAGPPGRPPPRSSGPGGGSRPRPPGGGGSQGGSGGGGTRRER